MERQRLSKLPKVIKMLSDNPGKNPPSFSFIARLGRVLTEQAPATTWMDQLS